MEDRIKIALEENLNRVAGRNFQKSEIKNISWKTFKKYVEIEHIEWEEFVEVSIEDLVSLLNRCSGEDCWGSYWEYRVIDGKPYEVINRHAIRIVKVNF